ETATFLKQTAKMNLTELKAETAKVGIEVPEKASRGWLFAATSGDGGARLDGGSLWTLPRVDVPRDPGRVPGVGHGRGGEKRKRSPEEDLRRLAAWAQSRSPGDDQEKNAETPWRWSRHPWQRESYHGIPPTGLEHSSAATHSMDAVSEADRERITRLETELAALRDTNNLGRVTKKEVDDAEEPRDCGQLSADEKFQRAVAGVRRRKMQATTRKKLQNMARTTKNVVSMCFMTAIALTQEVVDEEHPDLLEIFAGKGRISRTFEAAGLAVLLLELYAEVMLLQKMSGGHTIMENPSRSALWREPLVRKWVEDPGSHTFNLDLCCFGMVSLDGKERLRKTIRLTTTSGAFEKCGDWGDNPWRFARGVLKAFLKTMATPGEHTAFAEWQGSRGITFSEQIPAKWAAICKKLRQNLGHPPNEELARQLKYSDADEHLIRAAKCLKCHTCRRCTKPGTRRPARPATLMDFGEALAMDVIHFDDSAGNKVKALSMVDMGSTYHVVCPLPSTFSADITQAYHMYWASWAGHPWFILIWRIGKEDWRNRDGYAPRQWVFGSMAREVGDIVEEPDSFETLEVTKDGKMSRINAIRMGAKASFFKIQSKDSTRRALLRRPRVQKHEFALGDLAYYYREYRPQR
ncbi:unnamed protein product, partial [Effrenium voratum]